MTDIEKRDMRIRLAEGCNWVKTAEQTIAVYEKALKNSHECHESARI